jgi:RNA polymerase sigma-70 factor, ECF subfamily
MRSTEQIRELLDSLYRENTGRIVATLVRWLGDFDLAEEAMHEAFAAALSQWPMSGIPLWFRALGLLEAVRHLG